MKHFDDVIEYYLRSKTTHALLITGEWGSGKTYYIKNKLKNRIEQISTSKTDEKKYRLIIVSLFGLKSIEDIQSEIFFAVYPMLSKSKLGMALGIGLFKVLARGFSNFIRVDAEKTLAGIDKSKITNISNIVICFDDLERRGSSLKMDEIFGYINSLVENEGAKILIVANDNKIENKDYSDLKEKVIGNVLEFLPDKDESFDAVIISQYYTNKEYSTFLTKNKATILSYFAKSIINLRILIFALSYFETIFKQLEAVSTTNEIFVEKKDEIVSIALKFTVVIAIEYKLGAVSYGHRKKLDVDSSFDVATYLRQKTEIKKEREYKEIFVEKYYSREKFLYFPSIYDFITGGKGFELSTLIQELSKYYHIEHGKVKPHFKVLEILALPKVFELSDCVYNEHTNNMLNYAYAGKYSLSNYLNIFYYATRFGNPLNLKLENLEMKIIEGMRLGQENYKYDGSLDVFLNISADSEFPESLIRLRNIALQINEEINSSNIITRLQSLEEMYYENISMFQRELFKNDSDYYALPVFSCFNVDRLYQYFLDTSGTIRWKIISVWRNRYKHPFVPPLKVEIPFFSNLLKKFEDNLLSIPTAGLTNFMYKENMDALKDVITKLNKPE